MQFLLNFFSAHFTFIGYNLDHFQTMRATFCCLSIRCVYLYFCPSSIGHYVDAQGNIYAYDSDMGATCEGIVDNYFYLEYNNLSASRKHQLFIPHH